MSRAVLRRLALLPLLCLGAVVVTAAGAATKRSTACDARKGSTVLENQEARVFSLHGSLYACTRPTGALRVVRDPSKQLADVSGVQLAGAFVAFREAGRVPLSAVLDVLDLKRGTIRHAGSAAGEPGEIGSEVLGDDVLNSRGTAVWILDDSACPDPADCRASSSVDESTLSRKSTLEHTTNTGQGAGTPTRSLGLSRDGTVAYWVTNGGYRGAHLT